MLTNPARGFRARAISFLSDESGQGLVEYGLILGLIAMVAIGALLMLGGGVTTSFGTAAHGVSNDPPTTTLGQGGGASN